MKYSTYNAVIIGSGISGLFLTNKLSENKNLNDGILLITKDEIYSGSSALAQGGIVSVIPEINKADSLESHIKDTIKSGCGLNDLNTVKFVSEQSSRAIDELMRLGVEFDKDKNGLNFTLEGAHSVARILHSKGDSTGKIIEKTLADRLNNKDNIEIYKNTMAVELMVDSQNTCRGIIVFNWKTASYEAIFSNIVVIATGGIGQLYKRTTNPSVSCGDGIAIALNAGVEVENMEFVQFHPTALYCKNDTTVPLVSESVRGEGAKLVDVNGVYFAKDYHPLAELAPRDIVSRAIINHTSKYSQNYVNLDISQIGIQKFKDRFPTVTELCEENDIDLSSGLIPVYPAEHYFMGGIKTDLNSSSNIQNLYAIGECASTGLHGANRLASNSLLECVVFANSLSTYLDDNFVIPPKRHDERIKQIVDKYKDMNITCEYDEEILSLFNELKDAMSNYVGIIRDVSGLTKAGNIVLAIKSKLDKISSNSKNKYELEFAITVSLEIIKSAIKRKSSIGAHYRSDCTTSIEMQNEFKPESMVNNEIHA